MTGPTAAGAVPSEEKLRDLADAAAVHVANSSGTARGTRTGWLMISTILIESWDLYSISFLLIFLKDQFHPRDRKSTRLNSSHLRRSRMPSSA